MNLRGIGSPAGHAPGSQRLLAVRDGTTERRNRDGARAKARRGEVELDAFALRLVEVEPDSVFNDGRNKGRDIAGLQATIPAPLGRLDAYYIFSEVGARRTIEGVGDERRHSLGLRAFGSSGGWFRDWGAVYQTGRFGNGEIEAWTLATNFVEATGPAESIDFVEATLQFDF